MSECKDCVKNVTCVERRYFGGNQKSCKQFLRVIKYEKVAHGRWIRHPDDLFPAESMQECSVCHEQELCTLLNENYCPNCGAKMDGDAP